MPSHRQPLGEIQPRQVPSRAPSPGGTLPSKVRRPLKTPAGVLTAAKDGTNSSHRQNQPPKDRRTEKGREYQLQLEHEKAMRQARKERQQAKQRDRNKAATAMKIQAQVREMRAAGQTQEEIDEFLADPEADEPQDGATTEHSASDCEPGLENNEFTYQQTYEPPAHKALLSRSRVPVMQRTSLQVGSHHASSPGPTRQIPPPRNARSYSSPGPGEERHPSLTDPTPQDYRVLSPIATQPPPRGHKRPHGPSVECGSDQDPSSDPGSDSPIEPPANRPKRAHQNHGSGRPKAHDYEGLELSVLKAAQEEFQVRVCTENAYPDEEEMELWALECWENACKLKDQSFELTERLRKLIIERHSTIRGRVKDKVVLKLVPFYGFKHGSHDEAVAHNKQLATLLLEEDGYVYTDPENSSGIYDHPILQEVINDQWFNDKKADGITFSASFNPIPDPTIALVFTAVEFAISRWTSGVYIKKGLFSEAAYHEVYQRHLSGLQAWRDFSDKAAKSLARIKQRLHDFGRSNARVPHVREIIKPQFNATKFARAEAALEDELEA